MEQQIKQFNQQLKSLSTYQEKRNFIYYFIQQLDTTDLRIIPLYKNALVQLNKINKSVLDTLINTRKLDNVIYNKTEVIKALKIEIKSTRDTINKLNAMIRTIKREMFIG